MTNPIPPDAPIDEVTLREQIEDLIVDTSIHPVDASLRIMALFQRYAEQKVKENLGKLDSLYTKIENEKPPATFSNAEASFNDGLYRGQLKALELVCMTVFGMSGDEVGRAAQSQHTQAPETKGQ